LTSKIWKKLPNFGNHKIGGKKKKNQKSKTPRLFGSNAIVPVPVMTYHKMGL
jgi:hypothetical protein